MPEEREVCPECGSDQIEDGRCLMCGHKAKVEPAKPSKKDEGKK